MNHSLQYFNDRLKEIRKEALKDLSSFLAFRELEHLIMAATKILVG